MLTDKSSIFVFRPAGFHEELGYGVCMEVCMNYVLVVCNHFLVFSSNNLNSR